MVIIKLFFVIRYRRVGWLFGFICVVVDMGMFEYEQLHEKCEKMYVHVKRYAIVAFFALTIIYASMCGFAEGKANVNI